MKIRFVDFSSAVLLVFALCVFADAQSTVPAPQFGIVPTAAYQANNVDAVNMDTGNDVIKIPLFSLPQLGKLSLSFNAVGNTTSLQPEQSCSSDGSSCGEYYTFQEPSYGSVGYPVGTGAGGAVGPEIAPNDLPSITSSSLFVQSCPNNDTDCASTYWYVIDGSGASYPLYYDANNLTQLRTTDGSGYLFQSGMTAPWASGLGGGVNSYTGPEVLYDSHGNKFTWPQPGQSGDYSESDPDGNTISVSRGGSNLNQITDSIGRIIPPIPPATSPASVRCPNLESQAPYQSAQSSAEWDVPGINGQTVAYTVCYTTVAVRTNFWQYGQRYVTFQTCCIDQEGDEYNFSEEEIYQNVNAIQSIVLPDGTYWGFIYDSGDPSNYNDVGNGPPYNPNYSGYVTGNYGTITKVLQPLGGSISYTYSLGSNTQCYPVDPYFGQWAGLSTPMLATRTVSDNNGNSYPWTYSIAGQGTGATNSAIDPNGNETDYSYQTNGYCGTDLEKAEYRSQGNGSSATLLSKVTKTYITTAAPQPYPVGSNDPPYGNPVPQTETTTPDSQPFSTTTSTQYAGSFSAEMPTCEFYYDTHSQSYVCPLLSGSLQAQPITLNLSIPQSVTTTDYSGSTINTIITAFQWQNDSNFLAANLLDTPSSITTYNAANNQVAQSSFTYDQLGHAASMTQWLNTNPNASPTSYFGWAKGNLSYTIDPDNHQNSNGHTVDYIYPGGSSPTFPYPSSVVNAFNQTTSYAWDSDTGAMTAVTDPNNQTISYTYDCQSAPYNCSGRLQAIKYPDNTGSQPSVQYAYSTDTAPTSFPATVTTTVNASPDPSRVKVAVYDGLARVIQTQLTSDPVATDYVNTTYDGLNNVASVTNPFRNTSEPTYGVTSFQYDALGRKTIQTQQDGNKLQWCYDGLNYAGQTNCNAHFGSRTGTWTDVADECKYDHQITANAQGRILEAAEPSGAASCRTSTSLSMETDYSYDALGNLLRVDQWGGSYGSNNGDRVRIFSYDSLSRLTNACNPESIPSGSNCSTSGPWSGVYTYDANGNVLSKTDARSIAVNYIYDGLNRLTQKSDSADTFSYNYYYDNAQIIQSCGNLTNIVGRLCYATNGVYGAQFYSYDAMGRVWQQWYWTPQDPNFSASSYVIFDKAGSAVTVRYPDGRIVERSFDGAGHLSSVTDPWNTGAQDNSYFENASYLATGQLSSAALGSGISVNSAFGSRLAAQAISYGTPNQFSKEYTWNANLTLQQEHDLVSGTTRHYTYDALNRLTNALDNPLNNGLSENYSFDPFGNMAQAGNFSFEPDGYSGNNQPSPSETLSGNQACPAADWCFDYAGNLLADPLGNSYTWDGESKLSIANGVTYSYYADGKRAGKTGSTPTDYIYFNGTPLTRYTGNGSWTDLIQGIDGILAEAPYSSGIAGQPAYRYTDHLGSSVVYSASSGSGTQDYAPFGQLFNGNNTGDPYKFTGKEYDDESGNDYFGARYYSSSMSRFLSPDWATRPLAIPYASLGNPQTLNLYSYAVGNPLRFTDPTGHWHQDCQQVPASQSVDSRGNIILTTAHQDCKYVPDLSDYPGILGNAAKSHLKQTIHNAAELGRTLFGKWMEKVKTQEEGNQTVTDANDIVGLAGTLKEAPMAFGLVGSTISIWNEPTPQNIAITALGVIPGPDVPVGIYSVAQDGSKFATDNVIVPVFTPDASQSDTINMNGITLPDPQAVFDQGNGFN
jgi:RHS repeat-associated protein